MSRVVFDARQTRRDLWRGPLSITKSQTLIERSVVLRSYLPGLVFLLLGTGVGVAFAVLNGYLGPRRQIEHKLDPYECGLPSEI